MSSRKAGLAVIALFGVPGLMAAGIGLLWLSIAYWGPRALSTPFPWNIFVAGLAGIFLVGGMGAFMAILALLGGIGRAWNRASPVT